MWGVIAGTLHAAICRIAPEAAIHQQGAFVVQHMIQYCNATELITLASHLFKQTKSLVLDPKGLHTVLKVVDGLVSGDCLQLLYR